MFYNKVPAYSIIGDDLENASMSTLFDIQFLAKAQQGYVTQTIDENRAWRKCGLFSTAGSRKNEYSVLS